MVLSMPAAAAAAAVLLAVLTAGGTLAQPDVLDVQAVQDVAAAARNLLQNSDTVGGYYGAPSTGRSLLQAGGYGGYGRGLKQQQPAGYGYGRRLAEDSSEEAVPSPLLVYAERVQARADSEQMAAQQAAGGVSAAAVAAIKQAHTSRLENAFSLPVGKCYCRFDVDFSTWALAEEPCRDALYYRCQYAIGLPCSWLDKFYAPIQGPAHVLPHEADIKTFVYDDCSPNPPCACAEAKFDGTDSVPLAVACCKDLRVACKTPFSGVHCQKVEAFCSDDTAMPVLAAWSQHVLHHSDCSSYQGLPYQFVTLQELQTPAASQRIVAEGIAPPAVQDAGSSAAETALLQQVMHGLQEQVQSHSDSDAASQQQQRRTVIILAAITAGAVCTALVAVVFATRREEASPPLSADAAPQLSGADIYQSLVKSGALTAPKPAACLDGSMSLGLHRDGSGDSCLSRVISIGKLSGQGSGIREPFLQQDLSRSVSNGSTYSSTSISGDAVP